MEGTSVFTSWQDMPAEARGRHRLERLGIPALRIRRKHVCATPFHVTDGQPTVGQGVVVHAREGTLLRKLTLLYIWADNRRGFESYQSQNSYIFI
ncbi:unnamed protein product [Spirodela intermedia]|uniref:Uncharacterized protein n=1 Tax=Spirodela intermedia TaxID=51605 RepID=A0ABN7E9C7_SPIIN|nr:unnamed protein product [Spirodela intermedia]